MAASEQTVRRIDSIVPTFNESPRAQLSCRAKAAVERCERLGRHV